MASRSTDGPSSKASTSTSTSSSSSVPSFRRHSSSASASSETASPRQSPKVQLVPYSRTASFDVALTASERDLLDRTSFDHLDLSSKDFDFEDIFTYDKPQRKLPKVVEVTTTPRERDWSNFSYSHYAAATTARAKANRNRGGIAEKYSKSQAMHLSTKRS